MSLLDLIHRRGRSPGATAIPAIRATPPAPKASTVAGIATVAVARAEGTDSARRSPALSAESAGDDSHQAQRVSAPQANADGFGEEAGPEPAAMQLGEVLGASDPADDLDAAIQGFQRIPEHSDDQEAAGLSEGSTSAALAVDDDGDDRPNRTGEAAARHDARLHRFIAAGLAPARAQAAVALLAARDEDLDDRRICAECSHYGTRGRCIAAASGRIPGAARDLQPVPDLLQRCDAFGLRKGLS